MAQKKEISLSSIRVCERCKRMLTSKEFKVINKLVKNSDQFYEEHVYCEECFEIVSNELKSEIIKNLEKIKKNRMW